MTAHLECAHWQGRHQNTASRRSHAAKSHCRCHEKKTIASHHGKLDDGQRHGVAEFNENGFAGVRGERRRRIPDAAKEAKADHLEWRRLRGGSERASVAVK